MSFGRFTTFAAILLASLLLASFLIRRQREAGSRATPAATTGRAPAPPTSLRAPAGPGPSASETRAPPPATPSAAWESQDADPAPDPLSDALCPTGMLLVDGTTCAEREHRCIERASGVGGTSRRCLRYEPSACRAGLALRFCVDRFEYPNAEGMLPAVMVTFEQARSACDEEGKRLCSETEWSFACAGPRGFAFPYGDDGQADACNVGHATEVVAPETLWSPREVVAVLERLDGRARSGALRRCVSAFGVRDLLGNVEEWVKSDVPGFERALRGGDPSSFPTCQTVRQMRQTGFRQLTTGFRCCRDPLVRANRREAEPDP